jgi:hypothetical protein
MVLDVAGGWRRSLANLGYDPKRVLVTMSADDGGCVDGAFENGLSIPSRLQSYLALLSAQFRFRLIQNPLARS